MLPEQPITVLLLGALQLMLSAAAGDPHVLLLGAAAAWGPWRGWEMQALGASLPLLGDSRKMRQFFVLH